MDATAGQFERIVTVHVPAADLERAKDRAARRLSRDIKIKGFRPGKAPRRMVEAMVGADRIRDEALEEALPAIVGEALDEAELRPAVVPEVAATRDVDDGVEVDVRVTLWPRLEEIPDVRGRRIVIDRPAVDGEEIAAQIDRVRRQFAELEDSPRPAEEGDFVLIDLSAFHGGERLEEASASDYLYEIGSGAFIPGLDGPLTGTRAGEIVTIDTTLPEGFTAYGGRPVELRVLVKGVRRRKLPELTDEWVSDVSELETVAELEAQLAADMLAMKRAHARDEVRTRVLDELMEAVNLELPEALVVAEMDAAGHRFVHQLDQSGIQLEDYFRITGQDRESFVADLRSQAVVNLRTRILLEAIAERENVEVTAGEIDESIGRLATASNDDPEELRRRLVDSGRVDALAGDILRRKTLDLLVELASPVDGDGEPVILAVGDGDDDAGEDDGDDPIPAEEE